MKTDQAVSKAVLGSIVSRSASGVCKGSTCGCGSQYCQQKCKWSMYRQYQLLCETVLSVEVLVQSVQRVAVAVVDSIIRRSVTGFCTGSTSGCCEKYCQ